MYGTVSYRLGTLTTQQASIMLAPWQMSAAVMRLSAQDGWSLELETTESIPVGARVVVRCLQFSYEFVCIGYEQVWSGGLPLYRYTMPWSVWHDLAATVVKAVDATEAQTDLVQAAATILERTPWKRGPRMSAVATSGPLAYGYGSAWDALNEMLAQVDYAATSSQFSRSVSSLLIEPSVTVEQDGTVPLRSIDLYPVNPDDYPILYIDPLINGATVTERVDEGLKHSTVFPMLEGEPVPSYGGTMGLMSYRSSAIINRGGAYDANDGSGMHYVEQFYDVPNAQDVIDYMNANINRLTAWEAAITATTTLRLEDAVGENIPLPGRNVLVSRATTQRTVGGVRQRTETVVLPITETVADLLTGSVEVSAGGLVRSIPLIQQRKEL